MQYNHMSIRKKGRYGFSLHFLYHGYGAASSFLICAMANAGFNPFGQVREQLRMVWQRYTLMLLSSSALRSAFFSSRESASHRYDWRRMAGPKYSSLFHQYEGQEVEQQAQRMHS